MTNILITGTSKGIGAATLSHLRQRGAAVIGHSTRGDGGDQLAADLSVPGAADALWAAALERLGGRIDVLINNAGVFTDAPIAGDPAEFRAKWLETMQINLFAAADLCRCAILHFQAHGGGRLVNLGSRAAHRGDGPANAHYAASKAGMVAMTKTYARAHAHENILAYAIAPGFVMTGMAEEYLATRGGAEVAADIPLGRVASVEEAAQTIAFAALDAPPSMTGATLDLNGASYVR